MLTTLVATSRHCFVCRYVCPSKWHMSIQLTNPLSPDEAKLGGQVSRRTRLSLLNMLYLHSTSIPPSFSIICPRYYNKLSRILCIFKCFQYCGKNELQHSINPGDLHPSSQFRRVNIFSNHQLILVKTVFTWAHSPPRIRTCNCWLRWRVGYSRRPEISFRCTCLCHRCYICGLKCQHVPSHCEDSIVGCLEAMPKWV